jgi:hypothetical protein
MQLTHFVGMVLKLASHAVSMCAAGFLTGPPAIDTIPPFCSTFNLTSLLRSAGVTFDARVLQGDRRLEEQLATLLESRMEMDAEWSAAQAHAMQPQVHLPACSCAITSHWGDIEVIRCRWPRFSWCVAYFVVDTTIHIAADRPLMSAACAGHADAISTAARQSQPYGTPISRAGCSSRQPAERVRLYACAPYIRLCRPIGTQLSILLPNAAVSTCLLLVNKQENTSDANDIPLGSRGASRTWAAQAQGYSQQQPICTQAKQILTC